MRLPQNIWSLVRKRKWLVEKLAELSNLRESDARAILQFAMARRTIFLVLYCISFVILHGVTNFYPLARLGASPWSPETGLTVAASVLLGRPIIFLSIVSHIVADWTTRA